jgi:peptide/nickel transport system substrate-binding protein
MLSADAIVAGTVDKKPNGTGAFVWGEWKQGTSVTLNANSDYWGDGPFVDSVELRVIPDESSVLAGVKAGEIDIAVLTDPVVVLQATSPLVVHRTPALAYHALMLNGSRESLSNVLVRQAISCAIDRQEVIDTAALGEGSVTGPITIPAYRSDTDGLPCGGQRNVVEAKRLLAEAGVGGGITLNTIVISGESSTGTAEGQSVQAQLAEVGITLELEVLETGIYVDRWLAADFDIAVAQNSGKPDPHQLYARYWPSDGNLNKIAGYHSDKLDELMAAGNAETDPVKRVAIYDQLSEELSMQSPWVWMYTGYEYRVTSEAVGGFVPMPNGSLQFVRQTSLAQ